MRRHPFFLLLMIAAACSSGPAALTSEQAAVLRAALLEIAPAAIEDAPAGAGRRRMKRELKALERTLDRGTAAELLRVTAEVRAVADHPIDAALELVLSEAEQAAQKSRSIRRNHE